MSEKENNIQSRELYNNVGILVENIVTKVT